MYRYRRESATVQGGLGRLASAPFKAGASLRTMFTRRLWSRPLWTTRRRWKLTWEFVQQLGKRGTGTTQSRSTTPSTRGQHPKLTHLGPQKSRAEVIPNLKNN